MKTDGTREYQMTRLDQAALGRAWNEAPWTGVPALQVAAFHDSSTPHRPLTEAKLAYDDRGFQLFFRVRDHYVRTVTTLPHGPVCKDSCVEFFFEPEGRPGYFNLEINCGGTPLMFFVRYPTPEGGAGKATPLTPAQLAQLSIRTSLPKFIPIEVRKPLTWWVQATIPFAVLEDFLGPLGPLEGRTWRANFYKIASYTSQPHWGCWSLIRGPLSFHQPEYFAPIRFAPRHTLRSTEGRATPPGEPLGLVPGSLGDLALPKMPEKNSGLIAKQGKGIRA
jgi:hypothetical protein